MLTDADGDWGDPFWREPPVVPHRPSVDWDLIWCRLAAWLPVAILLWTAIMLVWYGLP